MPRTKSEIGGATNALDILPGRLALHGKAGLALRRIAVFYGFEEIKFSPVEEARVVSRLFKAGLFDNRSPVFLKTKSGRELALAPSGSISALRAFVSHKMIDWPQPIKIFWKGGSFFAADRDTNIIRYTPECGAAVVGEEGPTAEAEIIQVFWKGLGDAGLPVDLLQLRLNATGCRECRGSFRSALVSYFRSRSHRLCKNCRRSLKKMPVRVFSCQEEQCRILSKNAPQMLDFLCDKCKKHLKGILEFLDEIRIPYFLDAKFFKTERWFDTMVFELGMHDSSGEKGVSLSEPRGYLLKGRGKIVMEGGRMSEAGEIIYGKRLDAVGGMVFLDALEELLASGDQASSGSRPKVFLVQLGELAKRKSFELMEKLREGRIEVRESISRDSIRSQLKAAEKFGVEVALILGQKEALDSTIIVREVQSGIQETIPQDRLIEFIKRKLKI